MDTKNKILALIKKRKVLSGTQLAEILGISRQAVNKHLKNLVLDGGVVKDGVTRGAKYRVATPDSDRPIFLTYKKKFLSCDLEEDAVFRDIALHLKLTQAASPAAASIAQYAFTEMLNNAIDHSGSEKCLVEAMLDEFTFQFRVRDYGIGIFYSVYDKFGLADEYAAVGEILKGKTTTMKERHSGEGIFFTSKSADEMYFWSHKTKLIFDNMKQDVFIESKKNIRGTEVFFRINRRSRKKLENIFSTFAPEEFDFRFEKTRANVKLYQQDLVSRSEARRLLHGLDKFKKIILDFKGVKTIGQGFADEIFRVFVMNNPHISFEVVNLLPSLRPIVDHVVDNKTKERLTIC